MTMLWRLCTLFLERENSTGSRSGQRDKGKTRVAIDTGAGYGKGRSCQNFGKRSFAVLNEILGESGFLSAGMALNRGLH